MCDFYRVAGSDRARICGAPGRDGITRSECESFGEVGDDLAGAEKHLFRRRRLSCFAVDSSLHFNIIRVDVCLDPRASRRRCIERLACRPALLIQYIDIVRDCVSANNIRHRDSGVAEIRVDVSIEVMYATFTSDADG